jgi:hypothetical protein
VTKTKKKVYKLYAEKQYKEDEENGKKQRTYRSATINRRRSKTGEEGIEER